MACQCDDCKMKAYLHIPTGLIFYNFNLHALLNNGTFKRSFSNWFEEAFERIDDITLGNDPDFAKANAAWIKDGVHRIVRQCSLFSDWPTEYVSEDNIEEFCKDYMENVKAIYQYSK